jgi:hypothetical protein
MRKLLLLLSALLAVSFVAPAFSEDNKTTREFNLVNVQTVKQYLIKVEKIPNVSPYDMAHDLREFLELATKNSWKIRYVGEVENTKWLFEASEIIPVKKCQENREKK